MLTQENTHWITQVQALFAQKLFVKVDSPDRDLFESGLLDSLSLVDLLVNLEQAYGFKISLAELDLDNFRSVSRIAGMLASAQPADAARGAAQ